MSEIGRGSAVKAPMSGAAASAWRLALALLLASAACGGAEGAPGHVGAPAPEYAAIRLDGDSVRLADLRGDVVLLNIWATWCHPCREEIPALQELHERHAAQGLQVVGVSVDAGGLAEAGRVRAFADEFGVSYPIWLDPNERVAREFFTIGVPTTVLIGRDGRIVWRHTGPIRPGDRSVSRMIEAALREPSPADGES
jgi:thiol-disulfide isomerase/thioredoxin